MECPVCLNVKIKLMKTACGHYFCHTCISHVTKCPMCRSNLDDDKCSSCSGLINETSVFCENQVTHAICITCYNQLDGDAEKPFYCECGHQWSLPSKKLLNDVEIFGGRGYVRSGHNI